MNIEVKVPAVGESISSGILSVWHKKDGDTVRKDEVLFTLETDKVSQEVNAPEAGLLHLRAAEGDEVKIGQTVAEIVPGAVAAPPAEEKPVATQPPPVQSTPTPTAPAVSPAQPVAPAATFSSMAPVTRSGEDPRVVRKKLSPLRRKIAAQLVMAQHTAAILTTFNECDMSAVMSLRKELQEEFTKRNGVKLGFMSFFVKAVVDALQAVPAINSRIDGDELLLQNIFDIGVAVGTERGLIVPVLRDCESLSFAQIELQLAAYAQKAREGKVSIEELQGGIFTISNGGVYGSLLSTPILNPPQSGILGMHKIQDRPVVVDGQIVIRPMMYLALSYDHRVVDGKEAVTFLVRVKECIENPARLLLGA